MTTDKEVLEQYRDELKQRIKHLFIWAQGESAITEMTRTVRDNDLNRRDITQLFSLFRLHFIPERNKFHAEPISSESQKRKAKQPKKFGHESYQ